MIDPKTRAGDGRSLRSRTRRLPSPEPSRRAYPQRVCCCQLTLLALTSREQAESIVQLKSALLGNRDIGVAIGIPMSRHKFTTDQGFDLLRIMSQRTHRKLVDLANDVIDTGLLELT
jgi:hypothetical protein